MNLYFLVEGKQTEKKVYPAWLSVLLPRYSQVDSVDSIMHLNYYLFSGEGYPSIIGSHLGNAIKDFKSSGKIDLLVVCLDADHQSVEQRQRCVFNAASEYGLPSEKLRVIVKESCIETWFLGNRKIVSPNPKSQNLSDLLAFYNVRVNDPELMGTQPGYRTRSLFHWQYFRLVAQDKNFSYSKQRPGHVMDAVFLKELVARHDSTSHLSSFGSLLKLCNEVA